MFSRSPMAVLTALAALLFGCGTVAVLEDTEVVSQEPAAVAATITPAAQQPSPEVAAPKAPAQPQAFDAREFLKTLPPNPQGGPDGLERSREWVALDWANPAEVSAWRRRESSDDVVLVVHLKGGPRDKVAVARPCALALKKDGKLRMDVYNATNREIPVAFAVQSSVDEVYSESIGLPAKPGCWSRLEFDLAANNFKTAASDWKHTTTLWGPEDVRRLVVLIYDPGIGTVVVDRIEVDVVEPEPEGEKA